MAKDAAQDGSSGGAITFDQGEIARARDCFRKAQELAAGKNYDYAIEWYINGLAQWPEAVDEGHKPCRAASLFRGKKKIGFTESMKYKTSGKDAKQAMLNAEMLLSREPQNLAYMEAMFKAADRAGYIDTLMWIGEIYADAADREEKPNPARFTLMRQVYETLGDRVADRTPLVGIQAMQRAFDAQSRLRGLKPTDGVVANELRDLAGKLTILKGKYGSADSFQESVSETADQRELHDKERLIQSQTRMDELIVEAQAKYEADPTNQRAISDLVELLCRREHEASETPAIGLLDKAFKDTEDYRYKLRADDRRIRQLNRRARDVIASGNREKARELLKEQLRFELGVFKDRVRQYPTDLRIRYQYGVRLFKAGRHDEAIPVLQEARNDPKTRQQCSLHIGRCFFEKQYYTQAVDTFRDALANHEIADDDLGKDLHYWLGRAFEADGQIEDALKTYGQLIQWDYNYRNGDVRKRIDDLKQRPQPPKDKPRT